MKSNPKKKIRKNLHYSPIVRKAKQKSNKQETNKINKKKINTSLFFSSSEEFNFSF